ncbi:MAG: endonuclease/exonuclease/phosphatase family protein [Coraliomargarita sp.]
MRFQKVRYLGFAALSLMLGCVCVAATDSIRVATLNLDNYLSMNRVVDGQWRPNYPKPESEKVALREAIIGAQPQILALQEIGEKEFLEELRSDLAHEGLHYPYAVHFRAEDDVRHLAVLSMLPPREVQKHTDMDFKYFDRREKVKRGMLEMSFELSGDSNVRIFVVHLKSRWTEDKRDPEADLRRTKEAEACRNRIVERTTEMGITRYCVAGDFNADPSSAPMRRFYQRGDLAIGTRVPAADSRGEVWTHFYKKKSVYSTLDGFVASPALMKSIVGGSGTIWDTTEQLAGSDHRMVYMDVEVSSTTAVAK